MGDLSAHFDSSEFRCKCGCGICNVSPKLLTQLEQLRNAYRKPMIVASGCRCPAYNAQVGGVENSAHLSSETEPCEAVDIRIHSGGESFQLLDILLFQRLFRRIGVGTSLLHLDVDSGKPQDTIWVYPNK
jgi:zinc D-Ala-D-Ala carboxypeptidase